MTPAPPGPPSAFPLGILMEFRRDPLGTLERTFRSHGDRATLPDLFGQQVYLLHDPEDIRAVLVAHADKIEKPAPLKWIFRSSFGNGLFFSEGAFWYTAQAARHFTIDSNRLQGGKSWMEQRWVMVFLEGQPSKPPRLTAPADRAGARPSR